MTSTNSHPDGLTTQVLRVIERQVSAEIAAAAAPTSALLDGTARQRRDLRILARRLNGIAAKYGVTLEEAISKANETARPVVVTLDVQEAIVPVPVGTTEEPLLTTDQGAVAADSLAVADSMTTSTTVPVFGATQRPGRKARRAAARRANLSRVA